MWIDEAGQVGTSEMNQILAVAKQQSARVILSYDTKQHTPVAKGDAVRQLEAAGVLAPAEVKTIHRQRGNEAYRSAVADFSEGRTDSGFKKLEAMGAVYEIKDDQARYERVAERYADTLEEKKYQGKKLVPKTCLVVCPTHRERGLVASEIRTELKGRDLLGKRDRSLLKLESIHLTNAEKSDSQSYSQGQWVAFHQNVSRSVVQHGFDRWVGKGSGYGRPNRGIMRGERFEVVGRTDKDGVLMRGEGGRLVAVPLDRAGNFSVFDSKRLPVTGGEVLRVTQGGRTLDGHELRNGATYKVAGFNREGDIRLSNGWLVDSAYGHLDHGYTRTSAPAQGSSVDRVLVAQDSKSGRAASQEQFNVSVSRGKQSVEVFTDDKERLRKSISRSSHRTSGLEVATPKTQKEVFLKHLNRAQRVTDNADRLGLIVPKGMAQRSRVAAGKSRSRRVEAEPDLDVGGFEPDV